MFLSPTDDLGENQLFIGQKFFQVSHVHCLTNFLVNGSIPTSDSGLYWFVPLYQLLLLSLALISVPWMLFPKPFLLKKQHEEVSETCGIRLVCSPI